MVAPSLDKRPIGDPDKLAVALLASLPGYKDVKPGEPHDVKIGDLDGVEVEAARSTRTTASPMRLYQAMLLGKDGGYYPADRHRDGRGRGPARARVPQDRQELRAAALRPPASA